MDQDTALREITPGASRAPAPAWVDLAPYEIPAVPNPHFIAGGLCALLDDTQIDLCGPARAWYCRRADMVTAPVGAERAAQVSVSFDPAFERVEIHSIAVIRNGRRIDHTESAQFEVLRRERQMEMMLFDGRLTLHATLPDVREGDVVESSYTLYGMRKSLQNKHAAWLAFEWPIGVIEVRVRQRAPSSRRIHEKGFCNPPEARQTEADGVVERRWRSIERKGVRYEALAPMWVMQSAVLQLSEWQSWGEVAQAFTPLYDDDGALDAEVEAEIARIAAEEPTQAGQAAAILRFTQSAVRYLAISMGEGGYTPRSLADICSTRYGDCKDKSKLFVQMARKLGLEACPALVNTRDQYGLENWLPSALAFDHCIVRVTVDGRVYYVDPTRSTQPSPFSSISLCHFGWALPLQAGTAALERMPDPTPAHTLETVERVKLGKTPDKPVRYEWQITSRRGRAEWVRELLAREGIVGLFKLYADDIGRRYSGAAPIQQDVLNDDRALNEVTALEIYEISDAWTKTQDGITVFGTHDLSIKPLLSPPDAGPRKHPIYLGQVGKVTRRVEIEAPFTLKFGGWSRAVDSSALSFKSDFRKEGARRFVLEQSLEFRALTLPAAEADKYRAIVSEIDRADVMVVNTPGRKGMFIGADDNGDDKDRGFVDLLVRVLPFAALFAYWGWLAYRGQLTP
ncbi:DUF3857 domain-containing transglutaminase family protein [Terricaulis sp.]|uniref:DUF3857 domain-containing transglutaminase family protein n=1 Tax=Terricaulis sp. TaxID=2768686 RepID=UPI0037831CA7